MQVVSTDNKIQKHFSEENVIAITADGRLVGGYYGEVDRPFIFDLKNRSRILLPKPDQGCSYSNGSPDLSRLLVWCNNGEIQILNVRNGNVTPVAQPTNQMEYYSNPQWSPDGSWIAYFNRIAPFETDPGDGLHLEEISCPSISGTCNLEHRGPFLSDIYTHLPYAWSPNSQEIALIAKSDTRPIQIFDLNSGKFQALSPEGGYGFIESVAWSPDGEWIAYSRSESNTDPSIDIFLVKNDSLESLHLVDTSGTTIIYFWLSISWPFQPGDTYQITQAGANLNLRQSPTIDADILQKLQTGNVVQILEGPVVADGYSWWRFLVIESGTEGWAVNQPTWYEPIDQ
ncbi:SH3 domain-containing protein [Chloroflexota bacterium]